MKQIKLIEMLENLCKENDILFEYHYNEDAKTYIFRFEKGDRKEIHLLSYYEYMSLDDDCILDEITNKISLLLNRKDE